MTTQHADAAVRDLYSRLLDAWNRRSADDFAGLFADDGTIIGFDGSVESGAARIRDHLSPIFADHPTAAYVATVREVRHLGSQDAVLLRALAGMLPPGSRELNPATNAHQTVVAERQGETWKITLFQNTPAQYHGRPHLVEQDTAELGELLTHGTPPR
ncbi:SgcJ/EcaC family oxidoreductase [Streptomyces sp. NPDC058572]|uniref:SgcJ/EcaC family oxidoreductase n=1 Tax=Streptomyces sp. NPDC058572 TaxID=3346546 RepID=UPI00364D28B0